MQENSKRSLRIIADSSADILKLGYKDFFCTPMKIITNERKFVDDAEIDVDGMIDFFDTYKGRSQTSCPNVGDWLRAFGDADDVICVTITSALSGSFNSACSAKSVYEAENAGKRVFVLDTLSAGPEITLVVKKLEEYVESGMQYEDICEKIREYLNGTGLIFMLKSLKNFANNGRVSPLVAKIAGIAGICIVGKASDVGTLEPSHKCIGELRSLEALVKDLEASGLKKGRVSIGHAQNERGAVRLKQMIEAKFGEAQVEIHKMRGLCSFYAEKGGILVGFEKK